MTERKIEVGKWYILIHGHNEGPDWGRSPSVHDIDLSQPVTVIREWCIHDDGEMRWEIRHTKKNGYKYEGYASDHSFGEEVK